MIQPSKGMRSYLHFLSNCQSIETLWDAHMARMDEYGFDRLIYGFTRYRSSSSLGDPEDFILLTNHDKAYTDVFLGEQHYAQAPMVNWALNNEVVCSWGILAQMQSTQTLTDAERRVLAFNYKMDVTAGYTISFKSVSARSKRGYCLNSETRHEPS